MLIYEVIHNSCHLFQVLLPEITLFMFERMCEKLDMKAQLIITDKNPDVPNPMGKTIVVDLISDDEDE